MWKFLFNTAVLTAVAAGAKKIYDYFAGDSLVLTALQWKNGKLSVEGDSVQSRVKSACSDVLRERGVSSAKIELWNDGRVEFSGDVDASAKQILRNILCSRR